MSGDFIKSLWVDRGSAIDAIAYLRDSVIELNTALGIGGDVEEGIATYQYLCESELAEIHEAVKVEDRENFVKEVVDYLVVGFYLDKLMYGKGLGGQYKPTPSVRITTLDDLKEALYEFQSDAETLAEVAGIFEDLNIDHQRAVEEVLESNLSKFPTAEELEWCFRRDFTTPSLGPVASQCVQLEGERYSGVTCEKIKIDGVERLVFWSEKEYGVPTRKYLKPATYKEADMSGIFNN